MLSFRLLLYFSSGVVLICVTFRVFLTEPFIILQRYRFFLPLFMSRHIASHVWSLFVLFPSSLHISVLTSPYTEFVIMSQNSLNNPVNPQGYCSVQYAQTGNRTSINQRLNKMRYYFIWTVDWEHSITVF